MDIEKAWCIHKSYGSRSKQLYSNCHYATSNVWLPYRLRYWSRLEPGSGRGKMRAGNVPFFLIMSVLHYFDNHGCEKAAVEIIINAYVWLMFFFRQTWPCPYQTHKIYIESLVALWMFPDALGIIVAIDEIMNLTKVPAVPEGLWSCSYVKRLAF